MERGRGLGAQPPRFSLQPVGLYAIGPRSQPWATEMALRTSGRFVRQWNERRPSRRVWGRQLGVRSYDRPFGSGRRRAYGKSINRPRLPAAPSAASEVCLENMAKQLKHVRVWLALARLSVLTTRGHPRIVSKLRFVGSPLWLSYLFIGRSSPTRSTTSFATGKRRPSSTIGKD